MACALHISNRLAHKTLPTWQLLTTTRGLYHVCPVQLLCSSRVSVRWKTTGARKQNTTTTKDGQPKTGREIDIARKNPYEGLSMGEKVKEAGKDMTYFAASIAALGVLGAMFYYIGRELFSGSSANGVYNQAYKRCKNDSEVKIAMGEPIAGYGEMTSRGRRRHVSHQEFVNPSDGRKHMRMKFYLQSPEKKATVNLEMVENDSKQFEYRYLFVQMDEYPYRTIILEDHR